MKNILKLYSDQDEFKFLKYKIVVNFIACLGASVLRQAKTGSKYERTRR